MDLFVHNAQLFFIVVDGVDLLVDVLRPLERRAVGELDGELTEAGTGRGLRVRIAQIDRHVEPHVRPRGERPGAEPQVCRPDERLGGESVAGADDQELAGPRRDVGRVPEHLRHV